MENQSPASVLTLNYQTKSAEILLPTKEIVNFPAPNRYKAVKQALEYSKKHNLNLYIGSSIGELTEIDGPKGAKFEKLLY